MKGANIVNAFTCPATMLMLVLVLDSTWAKGEGFYYLRVLFIFNMCNGILAAAIGLQI